MNSETYGRSMANQDQFINTPPALPMGAPVAEIVGLLKLSAKLERKYGRSLRRAVMMDNMDPKRAEKYGVLLSGRIQRQRQIKKMKVVSKKLNKLMRRKAGA